jgi:hypothetical protein
MKGIELMMHYYYRGLVRNPSKQISSYLINGHRKSTSRIHTAAQILAEVPGSGKRPADGNIYLFRARGVGSSDASWPSKARRPVLNLVTLDLLASCVLEGHEGQIPGNSSELAGYLARLVAAA